MGAQVEKEDSEGGISKVQPLGSLPYGHPSSVFESTYKSSCSIFSPSKNFPKFTNGSVELITLE